MRRVVIQKFLLFLKKDAVLVVSICLAVLSAFFVAPDIHYIEYIDYRTIGLLFCLMAVIAGLQQSGVFNKIGKWLLAKVHTKRQAVFIFIALSFFGSMVMTNDVALIVFVPFAIYIFQLAGLEQLTPFMVVLQTLGANLGSMLTPIGNPQNLYIYTKFHANILQFAGIMLPYCAVSFLLLLLCLLFIKNAPLKNHLFQNSAAPTYLNRNRLFLYLFLFFLCLMAVSGLMPWYPLPLFILILLAAVDRRVLKHIDYSLLLTFVGFFIFIGNMERLPAFSHFFQTVTDGKEVLIGVLASQVISNVPASLMLSNFTDNWKALLIGVNLGGLGTLIASMASLISYKYISRLYPKKKRKYLFLFTGTNLVFLLILLALYLLCGTGF